MAENTTPRVIRAEKAFAPTTDPTQAKGHIIQADWAQTDASKMDYIHNKPEIPVIPPLDSLASLEDLDKQQVKIVNRSGKVYTSQIKIGDLEWDEDLGSGTGMTFAPIVLPAETSNTTEYTIRMLNPPTTSEIQQAEAIYGFHYLDSPAAAFAIIHNLDIRAQEIIIEQNIINPSESDLASAKFQALSMCDNYMNCPDEWNTQLDYSKALNIRGTQIDQITFTGPWYVYCGESYGADFNTHWHIFENSIIEYSFIKEESDEEALGPVHNIDLRSNTEVHYDYPLTELTINNLIVNDPRYSHEWTISFIAGDEAPIITMPNTTSINKINTQTGDIITTDVPIKWLYAEPIFEANRRYLITFKQIIDTIYGVWTVLE